MSRQRLTAVVGVLGGVLVVFLLVRVDESREPARDVPPPADAPAQTASDSGVVLPGHDSGASEISPQPLHIDDIPPVSVADAAAPGDATWTALLMQPDGTPAVGVPWTFDGEWSGFDWSGVGRPPRTPQSGVTGRDGRIVVNFPPTEGAFFSLKVTPPELATVAWASDEKLAGVRDLGNVTLVRGATLHGRVTCGDGRPVPAGVELGIDRSSSAPGSISRVSRWLESDEAVTDADGAYAFRDVWPGHVKVYAHVPATRGASSRELDLAAGEEAVVDLVYDGPAVDHRIVVDVRPAMDTRSLDDDEAKYITLHGGSIEARHPVQPEGWAYLAFEDLPPGVYTVDVTDPAFDAWRRDNVSPGPSPLRIGLVGNTSLEVQAIDAATRAPVELFGVALQSALRSGVQMRDGVPSLPYSSAWAHPVAKISHPAGRVVIDGLEANPHAVHVEAPGYLAWDTVWMGAEPHGQGAVLAELHRAVRVSGQVVLGDGRPAARVRVGLFDAPWDGAPPQLFVNEEEDRDLPTGDGTCLERTTTRTDDSGRFVIENVPTGRFVVRAYVSSAVDALSAPLDFTEGQLVDDVRLVLPDACWLDGRIALPPGMSGDDLCVAAGRVDAGPADAARALLPIIADVGGDGRFRLGPAIAGTWDVWVLPGRHWQPMTFGPDAWTGAPSPAHRIGRVTLPRDGEQVFELGSGPPGYAEVHVSAAGQPAAGLRVNLFDPSAPAAELASGTTNDAGVARIGPLWPAETGVAVTSPVADWVVVAPNRAVVPPGGVGVAAVSLDVVEAELDCVDAASGQPLANTVIVVYSRTGSEWQSQLWRTDARGTIRLQRPAGELRILRGDAAMDNLVARSGESVEDFMQRSFSAGRAPFRVPGGIPAVPAPNLPAVTWSPGTTVATVSL